MIRVRACTMRCRCHSSCRRSRFSQLGTQICGKSSFSSNFRISCASWRSVFCLRTRLVRISAASPVHNSRFSSASSRSNQRACPLASIPTRSFIPLGRESAVELLRFLAVLQPPLLQFSTVGIHKRNLLEGRVVIASYNHHVRLLSPEPFGWFAPPKLTRVWEPTLLWSQLHQQSMNRVRLCKKSHELAIKPPSKTTCSEVFSSAPKRGKAR